MTRRFQKQSLFLIGILVLIMVVAASFVRAPNAFLLSFAGILIGVLLHSVAKQAARIMPYGMALGLTLLLIVGAIATYMVTLGPTVIAQLRGLSEQLPSTLQQLEQSLANTSWGIWLLEQLPMMGQADIDSSVDGGAMDLGVLGTTATDLTNRLFGIASTFTAALKNVAYVLLLGVFLAASAPTYTHGFSQLFPDYSGARRVLHRVYCALQGWLTGQLVAMLTVGTIVGVALWLLGVPFALGLGIIVFVLEFIPAIGPIIAAVPAVLLATTVNFETTLGVIALFIVVEFLEGNIILPLLHSGMIDLPPAVTLFSLFLMGSLFGFVGVLVAAPLAAVVLTLVKLLYVQNELGRKVDLAGEAVQQKGSAVKTFSADSAPGKPA